MIIRKIANKNKILITYENSEINTMLFNSLLIESRELVKRRKGRFIFRREGSRGGIRARKQ